MKIFATIFVCVALIYMRIFIVISNAGENAGNHSRCQETFVLAWDVWDQTDPAKMPPLPEKPCLLIDWDHVYICSQEAGGCDLYRVVPFGR